MYISLLLTTILSSITLPLSLFLSLISSISLPSYPSSLLLLSRFDSFFTYSTVTTTAILMVSDPIDSFPFGLIAKKLPHKIRGSLTCTLVSMKVVFSFHRPAVSFHIQFLQNKNKLLQFFLSYTWIVRGPFFSLLHSNKLKRLFNSSTVIYFPDCMWSWANESTIKPLGQYLSFIRMLRHRFK